MPSSDRSVSSVTPPPLDRRAGVRRAAILAAISAARRGLGIRALAVQTGIHENTVRFHLDRLVADGLVERRTGVSVGPGRPPLVFVARHDRGASGRDNYELIARALARHLMAQADDPVAAAEGAGRDWGRQLAAPAAGWDEALDELVQVLDSAGFAPECVPDPEEAAEADPAADASPAAGPEGRALVRLHHCPFGALVHEDDSLVPCAVHLGLMRGILEAAGGVAKVDGLEPLVTPSLCLAHIARETATH